MISVVVAYLGFNPVYIKNPKHGTPNKEQTKTLNSLNPIPGFSVSFRALGVGSLGFQDV